MPDLDSIIAEYQQEYMRLDACARAHEEAARDPQNPRPWDDNIDARIYAERAVFVDEHIHRLIRLKEQA